MVTCKARKFYHQPVFPWRQTVKELVLLWKFGGGLYTGYGMSREYPRDLKRAFEGLQACAAWPARASVALRAERSITRPRFPKKNRPDEA